jgi:serine/threonine-protein kinase HipA
VADRLFVWLYGIRVAVVEQERGRLRLSYTDESLERFPPGTPLLSLALPLTAERYTQGVVRPFLDGLLPEGAARRAVAEDFGLLSTDTFGLIRALGRECAGAVVIQPADDPAPPKATTRTAEPLSEAEIAEQVANLRSAPLGVTQRVRISLAGVQEKLVLTRMSNGSWGRPVDGTPSTHILKPELAEYPSTVENEAFCMRVAKHLGLPVAAIETTTIAGRRLLIVERYDRVVHPDSSVERIHQEDLCQATGTPPTKKYQEDGGPSLRRVADLVQAAATPQSVETLLQMTTVNVLIGNGDAHAKNFSLLHESTGALSLAPLYDLVSTLHYGDDRLAMYVDDVRRTNRVTADRLVKEASQWGLSKRRASQVVADMLDRALTAVEAARDETEGLPDGILRVVKTQHSKLRSAFSTNDATG